MKTRIKHISIYTEILLLLLKAAAIAAAFFIAGLWLIEDCILDNYFERSDYLRKCDEFSAERFQDYVTENSVASDEYLLIDQWLWDNPECSLKLIEGDRIIYDDGVTERDGTYTHYDPETVYGSLHSIDFADKTLMVNVVGIYDYTLYSIADITLLALSFVVFLTVLLSGMRDRIRYILTLKQEIELLEGGSLDYSITIKGRDELTQLAEGLELMRKSFKKQIDEAEYLSKANQTMVTEISHDLRTPLTSVLLYSEILRNRSLSDDQRQIYLDKIVKKVEHLKTLSDRLLSYSKVTEGSAIPSGSAMSVHEALYDELSDLCSYLGEQGFDVRTQTDWRDVRILSEPESVSRVFNNISSNIQKYADSSEPVCIEFLYEEGRFSLIFRNRVSPTSDRSESTGIGIQSVGAIMASLGGSCQVAEKDGFFCIKIIFKAK